MSHAIDSYVAAKGVNAWHGLGVEVEGLTIEEACSRLQLEDLEKVPEFALIGGQYRQIGTYSAVRPRDGKIVGSGLGDSYKIHQPRAMYEFIADFVAAGDMRLKTAMLLNGGSTFASTAEVPVAARKIEGTDSDWVLPFVTIATSFDRSRSTTCYSSAVQVVCANTLAMADQDKKAGFDLRISHHTAITPEVVHEAKRIMEDARGRYSAHCDWLDALQAQEVPASADVLFAAAVGKSKVPNRDGLRYDVWLAEQAQSANVSVGEILVREILERENQRDIVNLLTCSPSIALDSTSVSSRRNGVDTVVYESIQASPGQEQRKGLNRLLGGLTYAVDHRMGRQIDTAMESAQLGAGRKLKLAGADILSQMLASDAWEAGGFRPVPVAETVAVETANVADLGLDAPTPKRRKAGK